MAIAPALVNVLVLEFWMIPEKPRLPVPEVNTAVPPAVVMSFVMAKLRALLRVRVPLYTTMGPVPKLQLVPPVPIWRVPPLTVMPPDQLLFVAMRVQDPPPSLLNMPLPRATGPLIVPPLAPVR